MKDGIHTARHFFLVAGVTAFVLLLGDRLTKYVAPVYFDDPYVVIPGLLELSYLGNKNFLFYWEFPIWIVFGAVSAVTVFVLWQLVVAFREKRYMSALLLWIVLIGGGSNLFDRMVYGLVVDMIRVPGWSVFNLADIYVVGGVLALTVLVWQTDRMEKAASAAQNEEDK